MSRITFRKTDEPFGWMHNMCRGYPIVVDGVTYKSSEALYQCFRFPDHPDVQRAIVEAPNGFAAKLVAKKNYPLTRGDWEYEEPDDKGNVEQVRVSCMRVAVELKFGSHRGLAKQLVKTAPIELVELSAKDPFWGAKIVDDEVVGENVLGRLLMQTRGKLCAGEPLMGERAALELLRRKA